MIEFLNFPAIKEATTRICHAMLFGIIVSDFAILMQLSFQGI